MTGEGVSIIIPTRNRAALLERAIRSVQNQTFPDWELIVVDDASTDNTPQLLAKLCAEDKRISLIRQETPGGGGGARNRGLVAARQKWVAFLDDDDVWLPDKLEKQLSLLRANPDVIACTCAFIVRISFRRSRVFRPPAEIPLRPLLHLNIIGGASMCLCSAAALEKAGGFDSKLRSCQDWDLWIRLIQVGRIISSPEILVDYDSHTGTRISNSAEARFLGYRRLYFKHRHLFDETLRRFHLATLCWHRSQVPTRSLRRRFADLKFAVHYGPSHVLLRFIRTSLPRIIIDFIKQCFTGKKVE